MHEMRSVPQSVADEAKIGDAKARLRRIDHIATIMIRAIGDDNIADARREIPYLYGELDEVRRLLSNVKT